MPPVPRRESPGRVCVYCESSGRFGPAPASPGPTSGNQHHLSVRTCMCVARLLRRGRCGRHCRPQAATATAGPTSRRLPAELTDVRLTAAGEQRPAVGAHPAQRDTPRTPAAPPRPRRLPPGTAAGIAVANVFLFDLDVVFEKWLSAASRFRARKQARGGGGRRREPSSRDVSGHRELPEDGHKYLPRDGHAVTESSQHRSLALTLRRARFAVEPAGSGEQLPGLANVAPHFVTSGGGASAKARSCPEAEVETVSTAAEADVAGHWTTLSSR